MMEMAVVYSLLRPVTGSMLSQLAVVVVVVSAGKGVDLDGG